jgi:hypothetical protein
MNHWSTRVQGVLVVVGIALPLFVAANDQVVMYETARGELLRAASNEHQWRYWLSRLGRAAGLFFALVGGVFVFRPAAVEDDG